MAERRGIATYYNGIKMRSRLETLWARVFDGLGWKWNYEPEVDFPDEFKGVWLPDFLLPDLGVLVECKPNLGPIKLLHEHPEVRRAARCCASIPIPLLVLGNSYVHWDADYDYGAQIGTVLHPDLAIPGAGWVLLFPGTKRWVNVQLAGDWDGCDPGFEGSSSSFWRDSGIVSEPVFPDLWNACVNANQWQPRRRK